jgi:hypothetical protein
MKRSLHWKPFARALLAVTALSWFAPACTVSVPPASAATDQSSPASAQVESAPRAPRLDGRIIESRGRKVGFIEAYPSLFPPARGTPVELQIQTVRHEQFDASVGRVVPRNDGWFDVEVELARPDARLVPGTAFSMRFARSSDPAVCVDQKR